MTDLELQQQSSILKAWQEGIQLGLEGGPSPIYTCPCPGDNVKEAWIEGLKLGRSLYRKKYNEVFKIKR